MSPMQVTVRRILSRLLPAGPVDAARQMALMALAYFAYRLTRGWIDDPMGAAQAFSNARELIHIEQSLGVFVEPAVQDWAESVRPLMDFSSWMYINAQT